MSSYHAQSMRLTCIAAALLLSCSTSCTSSPEPAAAPREEPRVTARVEPEPPKDKRVVLITLDTLRAGELLGEPTHMPKLRARAAQGLLFTRAYSATNETQPSHATLFTGKHPWEHGVTRNGIMLRPELTTLAESFALAGFGTHAVVASFPLDASFGWSQGFSQYVADHATVRAVSADKTRAIQHESYVLAPTIVKHAFEQLDAAASGNQFFFFHFYDAHEPYGDSAPEQGMIYLLPIEQELRKGRNLTALFASVAQYYERDARALDDQLDLLLERLVRDAAKVETLVVIVADHGESLGERGALGHGPRLTDEQIHVPLVILQPGTPPAVRNDVTGTIDVYATLAASFGFAAPDQAGRNLLRDTRGSGAVGMRRTFSRPFTELRTSGEKRVIDYDLFYSVLPDGAICRGNHVGQFADDGPLLAAAAHCPAILGGFEAALARNRRPSDVSETVKQQLRALGYAQ